MKGLSELFGNPEIPCVVTKGHCQYYLLNSTDVVPLFRCEVKAWGNPFHVFGKKDVRILVHVYKGQALSFISGKIEGLSHWFPQNWQDIVFDTLVGVSLVPMVVVIGIGKSAASRCNIVIWGVFAQVVENWNHTLLLETPLMTSTSHSNRWHGLL